MPPRYAYWTILVDNQPTAFRAGAQEDLMPTFKRLKEKHPSAEMKWFQNGKLWNSRIDAQEAMRARGEMGRRGDTRQAGGFRDRTRSSFSRPQDPKTSRPRAREGAPKPQAPGPKSLDWKPKGEFTPAPKRSERPEKRERGLEWKPRGEAPAFSRPQDLKTSRPRAGEKLEWTPRGESERGPRAKSQAPGPKPYGSRPSWTPKSGHTGAKPAGEKRKWVPKEEYKKSQGVEARRDKNWRPGGEHKDPRQKYKDAKKAKWTRFKKNIRARSAGQQPPGKKRRDEE
jgi:hypothetical protein